MNSIPHTEVSRVTYRLEQYRAVAAGVIESSCSSFLLLIAVRAFDASALHKGFLATSSCAGYLVCPLVVSLVARLRWNVSRAAALLMAAGALLFASSAAVLNLEVFVFTAILAMGAFYAAVPLLTQLYQDNYPENACGRLFSRTNALRVLAMGAFSIAAGSALSADVLSYRGLLLIFAAAFAFSAFSLSRMPSRPLEHAASCTFDSAVRCLKEDRVFRRTLEAWMFIGFGNLMMVPMRVEYLANPKYALACSAMEIALYVTALPALARLVASPLWGVLFDRLDFFALRIAVNITFMLSIAAFFMSDSVLGITIGSVLIGISSAGADISWTLWVTKFSARSRVAEYMGIHTFLTGLRGVTAPILSFQLARVLEMQTLAWFAAGLLAVGSAIMMPEMFGRKARRPEESMLAMPEVDTAV